MAWALNVKGIDPTAKLVLLGLANHAHKDGTEAFPAVKTLADYASVSERTARRHLGDLRKTGYITPTANPSGGRLPTTYRINMDPLAELELMDSTPDTHVPPGMPPVTGGQAVTPVTVVTPGMTPPVGGDDTHVPPGGTPVVRPPLTPMSPEPSLQPSVEPSTSIAPTSRRDELFEAVAEVCEIDWHELTPSARGSLNRAVADLRGVGAVRVEVFRRAANWNYDVPLTPPALSKHWPALGVSKPRTSTQTSRLLAMADDLEAQGL